MKRRNKKKSYAGPSAGIRPLKSYGVIDVYIMALTHLETCRALFPYLKTVLKDFFFLQFAVKFGWKKVEIIDVDHPLDDLVPFRADKVSVYLDFVNLWIRPLDLLVKRLGKGAVKYIAAYLKIVDTCYRQAAEFYRFRMSTTKRPTHYINFSFCMIHLLDPHYLCVPSLHVAISVLTYTFFRKVFAGEHFTQEEQDAYNRELFEGAVAVSETVLYIKQHSTNCIPAALYMMTTVIPDLFSIEEAVKFIDQLFLYSSDISETDKKMIHAHLHLLFEQLILEGCHESCWIDPMKRWILKYKKNPPVPEYINELPDGKQAKKKKTKTPDSETIPVNAG